MFPKISHLDDVLNYIEHKDEFKIRDKEDYLVIDYAVQKEDTFDSPQAMECRGIKFWPNGGLAARPISKFMNRGERPDLEEQYYTDDFRIFEKLDGSLVHFLPVKGELRAMTKGGITDVSEQCEREIDFHPDFWSALQDMLDLGLTPCFEFTSPTNRIVVRYEKPELTLIAVRDNYTGEYKHLDDYANVLHVPRVKEYVDITPDDVKEWVDREGVVLVWDSGYRLKCKSADYVLKHRTKDQLSQEKNVLEFVINDQIDDLAEILDEDDYRRVRHYSNEVWKNVGYAADEIESLIESVKGKERKEAALETKDKLSKPLLSAFWQAYDGKDSVDAIVAVIRKNLTSQSKVDSIRPLIGTDWVNY